MADDAFGLTAEWALWGKQGADTAYHVLACSAGTLTAADFRNVVERYAHGTADRLPQHTVFWVPGPEDATGFVGVAIHEHASYVRPDGRSRYDASGREIVFIRLFCVRYADLAEHGVTFAGLLTAVQQQGLPPQNPIAPITLDVASAQSPGSAVDSAPELAEVVAALLLTTSQVCILGADEVPAPERLAFIDEVLSLLPYGLRATLSASTWASPTAQDLKLRLFFASVRRGGGRTHHVWWQQPGLAGRLATDSAVARRYLEWLRGTGPRARFLLMAQTTPLRFSEADISQLVAELPSDLMVADILEDLAASLSEADPGAARAEIQRLERHLAEPVSPADRDHYRSQVVQYRLLSNHSGMNPSTEAHLYRTLLQLAFEAPISYFSYCEIEDCVGGPPHETLRAVLLEFSFTSYVPWLLVASGEPRLWGEDLMTALKKQVTSAAVPLDEFARNVATIRPAHRATAYDFAVHCLRAHGKDPRGELTRRGYLADMLEAAFPGDQRAQRLRLEDTLRFVHGGPLSRGQIRDLFSERDLQPTAAFEAAVTRLASSPKAAQLIKEQAAYARIRYAKRGDRHAEHRDGFHTGRRTGRWHLFIRHRRDTASPDGPVR